AHALLRFRMMVAQAPLIAPEPLLDPRAGALEGGIGVARLALAAHQHAAADMDLEIAVDEMPLAREHDVRLDRVAEILARDLGERGFRVMAQGVAHVDLLSRDNDVHAGP